MTYPGRKKGSRNGITVEQIHEIVRTLLSINGEAFDRDGHASRLLWDDLRARFPHTTIVDMNRLMRRIDDLVADGAVTLERLNRRRLRAIRLVDPLPAMYRGLTPAVEPDQPPEGDPADDVAAAPPAQPVGDTRQPTPPPPAPLPTPSDDHTPILVDQVAHALLRAVLAAIADRDQLQAENERLAALVENLRRQRDHLRANNGAATADDIYTQMATTEVERLMDLARAGEI